MQSTARHVAARWTLTPKAARLPAEPHPASAATSRVCHASLVSTRTLP